MKKQLLSLSVISFLLFSSVAFAQITGEVRDSYNIPEADVEVKIKGKNE